MENAEKVMFAAFCVGFVGTKADLWREAEYEIEGITAPVTTAPNILDAFSSICTIYTFKNTNSSFPISMSSFTFVSIHIYESVPVLVSVPCVYF